MDRKLYNRQDVMDMVRRLRPEKSIVTVTLDNGRSFTGMWTTGRIQSHWVGNNVRIGHYKGHNEMTGVTHIENEQNALWSDNPRSPDWHVANIVDIRKAIPQEIYAS